jgi:predicted Zn-dependent protease with MMP-like domain
MTDEEFEKLVAEGIDRLPPRILAKLKNVAIVIEDEPTSEQHKAHTLESEATLFGLYEGVPQTERGIEFVLMPDKISIFKKPTLEAYQDSEDIRECVANTVWHEVAHYFGMDEDEVGEEEIKRGKLL